MTIKNNIEVAVRARPLNLLECNDREESAWEVSYQPDSKNGIAVPSVRTSYEAKYGESKNQIQLKNKYRFGMVEWRKDEIQRPESFRSKSVSQNRTSRNHSAVAGQKGKADQSWKYQSGALKQEQQAKQTYKTPGYTPTPMRPVGTPEYSRKSASGVSEFCIQPAAKKTDVSGYTSARPSNNVESRLTANKSNKRTRSSNRFRQVTDQKLQRAKSAIGITAAKGKRMPRSRTPTVIHKSKSELNFKDFKQRNMILQHKFNFDSVYAERDTNLDVYKKTVRKVTLGVLEGFNGTVFVYGQTGTGKTYTMMGHQRTRNDNYPHGSMVVPPDRIHGEQMSARQRNLYDIQENSGIMIYAMQDLFKKVKQIEMQYRQADQEVKFQIKLSYIEIYNEAVYDLLVIKQQDMNNQNLVITEDQNHQFHVNGANVIEVKSLEQVLDLIKIGERNKHYAETFLNHCSSRSHTMFRLHVSMVHKQGGTFYQTQSHINFVDLAGSEKISNYFGGPKQTAQNEFNRNTRLKEGLNINQSLFNLTRVIHMLSQRSPQHIPYRNSTLTKLLRSSLGGNSRTSIIICITPANSQIEQTLNSLQFGKKAMKVQNTYKEQVQEMKSNSLYMRCNLMQTGNGIEERVFHEVVQEYEAKIKHLENLIYDNKEIYKLKERVKELQLERERLIQALEISGDRTFYKKQLDCNLRKGNQVMNLKHAGDVLIQSKELAICNVESLMQDQDQQKIEIEYAAKSSKLILDSISQELKTYKAENAELRQECENLENAYQDIIGQFTKLQSMQVELFQLKNSDAQGFEGTTVVHVGKMSDRDASEKKQIITLTKMKEEKRTRVRKSIDGDNSGGHLKNFMRPYTLYSTNRKSSQKNSSVQSSPGQVKINSKRDILTINDNTSSRNLVLSDFSAQKLTRIASNNSENNPEHFISRQGISEDHILTNKNLNSTFGMKKQQQKPTLKGVNSIIKIAETIHGVKIDKSLYAQENNYRPGCSSNRSRSNGGGETSRRSQPASTSNTQRTTARPLSNEKQQHLLLPLQMQNQPKLEILEQETPKQQLHCKTEEDDPFCSEDMPFAPVTNFNHHFVMWNNQGRLQQFDVIKEEVHNENLVSSDAVSHSNGFDLSTPVAIPGYNATKSVSGYSQGPGNLSNCSGHIEKVNFIISANLPYDRSHLNGMSDTNLTPMQQILQVAPHLAAERHDAAGDFQNCNTFDKTLSKLSAISQYRGRSEYEKQNKQHTDNSIVDLMNDDLMMEFQLEQMLSQNNHPQFCDNLNESKPKNKLSNQTSHLNAVSPSFSVNNQSKKSTQKGTQNFKGQVQEKKPDRVGNGVQLKIAPQAQVSNQTSCSVVQPTSESIQIYKKQAEESMQASQNELRQSRARSISIDLSSTYRDSPKKENDEAKDFDREDYNYLAYIHNQSKHEIPAEPINTMYSLPKKFHLDDLSETLTPYGPICTSKSNISKEDIYDNHNSCKNLEEEHPHHNLINLNIKTRTPTNNFNSREEMERFFMNERTHYAAYHQLCVEEQQAAHRSCQDLIGLEYGNQNSFDQQPQMHQKSSSSYNHQQSISNKSFKPELTKELRTIEKTNEKLKRQNEEYKKFYEDLIKNNSSTSPSPNVAYLEMKSQQSQVLIREPDSSVNMAVKKNKFKGDCSNSINSGSTAMQSKIRESHQSHEFDVKSKSSATSSKIGTSQVSKYSKKSKNAQTNSPIAHQLLNERLNKFNNQIEPNWQQKSQASLDKMQQLQKEYEKIQQRRLKILANLGAGSQGKSDLENRDPVVLKAVQPKLKDFQPLNRKHSPCNSASYRSLPK